MFTILITITLFVCVTIIINYDENIPDKIFFSFLSALFGFMIGLVFALSIGVGMSSPTVFSEIIIPVEDKNQVSLIEFDNKKYYALKQIEKTPIIISDEYTSLGEGAESAILLISYGDKKSNFWFRSITASSNYYMYRGDIKNYKSMMGKKMRDLRKVQEGDFDSTN